MKNLKTLSVLAAGVASCALLCQPAFGAVLESGMSVLTSATSTLNEVGVAWEVDTTGIPAAPYEYKYTVTDGYNGAFGNNPGTYEPGAPGLRFFSVSFLSTPVGAVVLAPIAPATDPNLLLPVTGAGASWTFTPLSQGSSAPTLYFYSMDPPVLGTGTASDDTGYGSPYASNFPLGQQVPVPNVPQPPPVPDGGMTLSLLGFALMGLEGLRRKLGK